MRGTHDHMHARTHFYYKEGASDEELAGSESLGKLSDYFNHPSSRPFLEKPLILVTQQPIVTVTTRRPTSKKDAFVLSYDSSNKLPGQCIGEEITGSMIKYNQLSKCPNWRRMLCDSWVGRFRVGFSPLYEWSGDFLTCHHAYESARAWSAGRFDDARSLTLGGKWSNIHPNTISRIFVNTDTTLKGPMKWNAERGFAKELIHYSKYTKCVLPKVVLINTYDAELLDINAHKQTKLMNLRTALQNNTQLAHLSDLRLRIQKYKKNVMESESPSAGHALDS